MPRRRIVVPAWFALAGLLAAQPATIREEKQVIKTYPFSGPNPSPTRVGRGAGAVGQRIYPYFSFEELSSTGVDQAWNVVRMENPYIEAFVLPAVGGKLIGALEKSTGNAFIYYNHALKFRNIAMRGPWTSGGIELNFPGIIGHAPWAATPVDYLIRKNPDGSVSCFVGTMDLPSRTEWRVEFRLPPDKAYLEVHSLYYNPQPLDQSYYVWLNTAEKATKDLELILPGTAWIGHNYGVPSQPWPIGEDGRNMALYKNHTGADQDSYFVHGALADFSGGYWHDSNFGYGHWALHEDAPGLKFWRWNISPAGAIWERLLTDSDGPYFEHQTGRLLDQSDMGVFTPYSADHWSELYFPYKKIGPMVQATPYGALNVRHTGDGLTVSFCALQKIDERLVVRAAGKPIYTGRIALNPMEVYEKQIPASAGKGELRVEVGDKLTYTDDPNDGILKRPLTFRNYDASSLEGLYRSAEREDRARNYESALQKYLACLERDPSHVRALTGIAGIYCRRAEYRKGLEYAHKALDYVMYDPGANYIYGILSRRLGDLVDAKETLGWAARSMQYRSSAYSELGGIYIMEGNLPRAEEYLKRSLEYDAGNLRTLQALATVYRLLKQPQKARETVAKILETDPLNHLAQFERYLLEPGPAALDRFKSSIRSELPHEAYLEIAVYYANLRLNADALRVLEAAPEHPTVRFWQAYLLREKSPEESRKALEKAASLSPYLVFPFREESIPVLQWASAARPGDWKAPYYLGLVYWGLRRPEDAMKMFEAAGDRPDYAPAYLSRAFLERGGQSQGPGRFRESLGARPKGLEDVVPPGKLLHRNRKPRQGAEPRRGSLAKIPQAGHHPGAGGARVSEQRAVSGLQLRAGHRHDSSLRRPERRARPVCPMPGERGHGGYEKGAIQPGGRAPGSIARIPRAARNGRAGRSRLSDAGLSADVLLPGVGRAGQGGGGGGEDQCVSLAAPARERRGPEEAGGGVVSHQVPDRGRTGGAPGTDAAAPRRRPGRRMNRRHRTEIRERHARAE